MRTGDDGHDDRCATCDHLRELHVNGAGACVYCKRECKVFVLLVWPKIDWGFSC